MKMASAALDLIDQRGFSDPLGSPRCLARNAS
jgi:hypothetical protein